MNQKNSLGLSSCFLDKNDPIDLFEVWMNEARKTELNDPNAVALGTSDYNNTPSIRMVLLKDFNKAGFVFYTNLNSQKGSELKNNPKAAMCFHWKSLLVKPSELMVSYYDQKFLKLLHLGRLVLSFLLHSSRLQISLSDHFCLKSNY